jgi:hypothetical protein
MLPLLALANLHNAGVDSTSTSIPKNVKKLMHCYSGFVTGYANNQVIFNDHTSMIWDDGIKNKTNQQRLDHPDLKDMFCQPYTTGKLKSPPAVNFDPGRIRNEAFFLKLYGSSKDAVQRNLTEIIWCPKLTGQKIMVTKINGIDKKLKKVSAALDGHPELKPYITNIAGTFSWRYIAGTTRQSMHSFGMTLDINTGYSDYWEWACKCTNENTRLVYVNRVPDVIVRIFEQYGFIWGGKWYHFDTMHFEYRPELIN